MGFARRRPLLGTFVTISAEVEAPAAMTAAFLEAERLQAIFSAHDPLSALSLYNSGERDSVPPELAQIIANARALQTTSENFFRPERADGSLDLSGIAKGFIVDQMVAVLVREAPVFSGVVNAGGDLRFIGAVDRRSSVRLGSVTAPLWREVVLTDPHVAFASSSLSVSASDEKSSTRYFLPLAEGFTSAHTACVAARFCWQADALTKVTLHAPAVVADRVAREYEALMVVFDGRGEVVATRGNT